MKTFNEMMLEAKELNERVGQALKAEQFIDALALQFELRSLVNKIMDLYPAAVIRL